MSDLKLDSLRIQNFRTFRDLTIDRLGRVNLIVGKNNVGKTALLEALWVWVHDEFWTDLLSLAKKRYQDIDFSERVLIERRFKPFQDLFHGWPKLGAIDREKMMIGPQNDEHRRLSITFSVEGESMAHHDPPWFELQFGSRLRQFSLSDQSSGLSFSDEPFQSFSCLFVSSAGLATSNADDLWDQTIKENRKGLVINALEVLVDEISDVSWVGEEVMQYQICGEDIQTTSRFGEPRLPMVTLPDHEKAVPLNAMGGGMTRAMGIGLGLANSSEGILLVDEIENGLHYSVQPDLWRMIFETAQELDVQVFVTTHSFDCIKAFQQAAEESAAEGRLISLRRSEREEEEGEIVAVPYDEDTLESVAQANIEVR